MERDPALGTGCESASFNILDRKGGARLKTREPHPPGKRHDFVSGSATQLVRSDETKGRPSVPVAAVPDLRLGRGRSEEPRGRDECVRRQAV